MVLQRYMAWDKSQRPKKYCIIGAGKTGMDSVCFLLRSGVHPDTITWIRPRDTWLFVRDDSGELVLVVLTTPELPEQLQLIISF